MQKQGKTGGHEIKNPAVWRKTGQPDTAKGSLGRNAFQNYQETNTVQGLGERPLAEHQGDKAFIQAQTTANWQEQRHATSKNERHKKEATHEKFAGDPLGLGFQGKGNKKIDLSRNGKGGDEGGLYSGHLPLIKDVSTVGGREKQAKPQGNEQKVKSLLPEGESHVDDGARASESRDFDKQEVQAPVVFPDLAPSENSASDNSRDAGLEKEYTKFPKMKTENNERLLSQNGTDLTKDSMKRHDITKIPEESVVLDSRLVPFEIADFNHNQNGVFPSFQRAQDNVALKQAPHEEIRQIDGKTESHSKREKIAKDPKVRLKEEIKQMKFRRSSMFRGISPQLSLSQKNTAE